MSNTPNDTSQPMRILLVEDDDDHAQIVLRTLRNRIYCSTVERVSTGIEALAYLKGKAPHEKRRLPDLILLDLKLPMFNGHQVLAEIKRDEILRRIPVVILTTSGAETDVLKAYEHHANSYLIKPLDAIAFRKMIEDLRSYWGIWNRAPLINGQPG